jgi:hypothetical protein
MADPNKLREEAAGVEEDILQTRIRIEEINRRIVTATEAELTALKRSLENENLRLQVQNESVKAAKEALEAQRKITEAASDSADALDKFIDNSSIARNLSEDLSTRYNSIASKSKELSSLAGENVDQVRSVAAFNNKILEIESVREKLLTAAREGDKEEQVIQSQKLESLSQELNTVISNGIYTDEQLRLMNRILQTQKDVSKEMLVAAGLTEAENEQYKKLIAQTEEWRSKIKAIGDMVSVFLKNPATLLGGMVIGAGFLVDKIGEVNKKLGTSFASMSGFTASAGLMSFFFDDAAETAKQLAANLGDSRKVTFGMQLDTNIIASNLGITGTEAAELVNQFGNLSGRTHEQAMNMIASAEATAKARGVVPNDLMKDLAENTEAFAKFGKNGGANIVAAAAGARQLGLDLKQVTVIADTLLDFESSIEKELELSAMLGKDINLNKARELFYAGDLENATKAVISQLGDKAEFDKMDVFQKKAAAEALGMQLTDLEKMYTNQENVAGASGVVATQYSKISEMSSYIANEWGGGILKGLGGALIAAGQMSPILKDMGINMGGMVKSSFEFIKNMGKAAASKIAGLFGVGGATSVLPTAGTTPSVTAPATPAAGGVGPVDQADKVSKIKAGDLIKGAAALLIVAAALFVAAKAFQEFGSVEWESVGKGLVGLAGLAVIAYALSKVQGDMISGAIAIAILGAALIPFAFALNMMSSVNSEGLIASGIALIAFTGAVFGLGAVLASGVGAIVFGAGVIGLIALGGAMIVLGAGLNMVGTGMSALSSSLPLIVEQISMLSQLNFLPILGLAASLTALAVALSAVATAGVLALPALAGINMMAGGINALFGGGEGGGENKELLDEIKGLRADLTSGKVAVYMDGHRVTAAVAAANSSNPLTLK